MKKRLALIVLLLLFGLSISVSASELYAETITPVTVFLNGSAVNYSYPDGTQARAFVYDGVTYLPIRAIGEAFGLDVTWDDTSKAVSLSSNTGSPAKAPVVSAGTIIHAASYGDVVRVLEQADLRYYTSYVDDFILYDGAAAAEAEKIEIPSADRAGMSYSGTNIQVDGVDEGDIIKTDGSYIYLIHNGSLMIFAAAGKDTKIVSSTSLGVEKSPSTQSDGYKGKSCTDLYVLGNRLIVLSNCWNEVGYETGYEYNANRVYGNGDHICADIYDISDPTAPVLLGSLGQDGYLLTSRLNSGYLYVVTSHSLWYWDDTNPMTIVPCVYKNGERTAMDFCDVCIMPDCNTTTYTVICVFDPLSMQCVDELCLLGGGSEIYMNETNLYLAGCRYRETVSVPWHENQYTVQEYRSGPVLEIVRLPLNEKLDAEALGVVEGYLDSQFSIDAYGDYVRIVTTTNTDIRRTYADLAYGFCNTRWMDSESSTALWILDKDLQLTGSVENLAPNENVYSVRFIGDIAYVCTFRNIDPLFALDVSNPKNLQVLSQLKITGFSDYLHAWSSNLLFGLGKEADAETGWSSCLKLTMFDVSDPRSIYAAHTALIPDQTQAQALSNHKAILISRAKNLICFAAGNKFYVYGYSDQNGFIEKGSLILSDYDFGSARSLYAGQSLYLIDNKSITVLDISAAKILAQLELP